MGAQGTAMPRPVLRDWTGRGPQSSSLTRLFHKALAARFSTTQSSPLRFSCRSRGGEPIFLERPQSVCHVHSSVLVLVSWHNASVIGVNPCIDSSCCPCL